MVYYAWLVYNSSRMNEFYAHKQGDQKELLIDHLRLVAEYAKMFGEDFNCGKVCEQLGLLHDVGKHTQKFQDVLFQRNGVHNIDHAIVGAQYFYDKYFKNHRNFYNAYVTAILASHHSDLQFSDCDYELNRFAYLQSTHKENALKDSSEYNSITQYINDNNLDIGITEQDFLSISGEKIDKMLYIRMLFSCLVDADYTATAEFENIDYYQDSENIPFEPESYLEKLQKYRKRFKTKSSSFNKLNELRNYVYEECSREGRSARNQMYTLNAPTGTAKTLALIKFALECAKKNHQKRIFVVLPYLSIISQNAEVYRSIFGKDVVLEDSSAVEFSEETKLYTERWSSPIIVTTSVRFFEIMFKARASEVRRLHQLANAVVVFDECQTLPPALLDTSIKSLISLTKYYHSTVVFSTATLPAYQFRPDNEWKANEIISDVKGLYEKYNLIKNTKIIVDTKRQYNALDLVNRFKSHKQFLFILNTVKKAKEVYDVLSECKEQDSVYLITSNMCSRHKLDTIETIKYKIEHDEECYLVSTQAIEIGVDIDFPMGAREFAPLDSIIQSAGRINRNGNGQGSMFVFEHENDSYPDEFYKSATMISKRLAEKYHKLELNNTDLIKEYYKQLYSYDVGKQDNEKLLNDINNKTTNSSDWFTAVAGDYKLIKDERTATVIVPYSGCLEEYRDFCEQLSKQDYRIKKRQMYECREFCVNIRISEKQQLILKDCVRLKLYSSDAEETDWYIAKEDMYDKTGLHDKKEAAYLL